MKSPTDTFPAVEFKPAGRSHIDTLTRLIKQYYAFDHIPFRRDEIGASLRTFIRDKSLGRAWLIRVGNRTAGYVVVIFWFDLEFGGRSGLITDLFLVPAHRRQGVGRKPLQFVESFCRESGINALELQVDRFNTSAQNFYVANGFQRHDRIPMSKRLLDSRTCQ